ncbi:MAG: hydrogenase nickel incorporation protein HypB [Phycisphaerae bacterium]
MTRILEVREQILKENDRTARSLRERFDALGLLVIDLVSSPGAGKTELLVSTISQLSARGIRSGVIVGDLATDNDAIRLAATGAPAKQIVTGGVCHLEAAMIEACLGHFDLERLDILFIENVGNLVCPATWDLGEDQRVLLFPVTEGEDKPLKYPTLINTADMVLITKTDLSNAVDFDRDAAIGNTRAARHDIAILEVSAKSGVGLTSWVDWLCDRTQQKAV